MFYRNLPLRFQLLIAFLIVTGISVAAVSTIASVRVQDSLLSNTGNLLSARANAEADVIGAALENQLVRLQAIALGRALIAQVNIQNQSYRGNQAALIAENDQRWLNAPDSDGLIISVTRSLLARDLAASAALDPNVLELMLTDRYGALIASASRTTDYNQADEQWWQRASQQGYYISQPLYDQSAGQFGLIIAVAMHDASSGALIGVLRSTYHLQALSSLLGAIRVGDSGHAELLLNQARLSVSAQGDRDVPDADREVLAQARQTSYLIESFGGARQLIAIASLQSSPQIAALNWDVLLLQSEAEALAPVNAARTSGLISALIVLALAAAVGLGFGELILRPIGQLTVAAERIAAGHFDRRLNLAATDELGRLAGSFDRMTEALAERIAAEQTAQAERLALQAEMIAAQDRRIEELAAPVIPLGSSTLLLPLIGSVDERRADHVLQTLLPAVARSRARLVLLDLTGVRDVDAQVAAALLRAAAGVRLLGAQVALVGLRPGVARTIAQLDIDLSAVPVYANLQAALHLEDRAFRD